MLAAAIYAAFGTRLFEIQKIDIDGSAETLEEQAAVKTYMQDFLGGNMLLLNTAEHESTLIDQYSYLKEINIIRRPFHTLIAKLITYDHIANVQVEHEDGSKQFFIVNELGSIASIGTTDETLPTIVMDVTGTDIDLPTTMSTKEDEAGADSEVNMQNLSVNQELLPPDILETLLDTKEKFEGKFNMQVMEVHYLKCARELHLFTERYFFVWIDLTQDVSAQLSKLKKSMTQLNIYEAPLEYVDLRVSGQGGEKVIYKLSE